MVNLIKDKLDTIITARKEHKVEAISLFGSATKNTMQESSDIDFLVTFSNDIDVL